MAADKPDVPISNSFLNLIELRFKRQVPCFQGWALGNPVAPKVANQRQQAELEVLPVRWTPSCFPTCAYIQTGPQ